MGLPADSVGIQLAWLLCTCGNAYSDPEDGVGAHKVNGVCIRFNSGMFGIPPLDATPNKENVHLTGAGWLITKAPYNVQ